MYDVRWSVIWGSKKVAGECVCGSVSQLADCSNPAQIPPRTPASLWVGHLGARPAGFSRISRSHWKGFSYDWGHHCISSTAVILSTCQWISCYLAYRLATGLRVKCTDCVSWKENPDGVQLHYLQKFLKRFSKTANIHAKSHDFKPGASQIRWSIANHMTVMFV